MVFHPFQVTIPHIAYACLGGFTVLFGMFSLFLREKLYIGEACWAFAFGVAIGPHGANIFNPRSWAAHSPEILNAITLEVTRVILAIGVFAIGVELPNAYFARHWKSLVFLLLPVMTWGWFISAGLIYALIPKLNFIPSLAIAACLTPTDPILASAIIGGKYADKHVPLHLRHLLAAESGCNDGAAFPFLYIALYLIIDANTGNAVRDWFLLLWLYQVTLGIAMGAALGYSFRKLMIFCQRKELIDRQSYVAQYVALAMLTVGGTTLLGTDDLLAAFACGTAFAWDGFFNRQTAESVFSSVIDLLFNVAAFVYVGAWMPFGKFQDENLSLSVWRLFVIAILVLLLRRLPAMIALYKWIPDVKTFREALFSGHFGPIGIGAVFLSTLASENLPRVTDPMPQSQAALLASMIQPVVGFMVLCSVAVHGLSVPSFSLGKRAHTLSRTWSRHAPPDWASQVRIVERGGGNIVINRDRDPLSGAEQGEAAKGAETSAGTAVLAEGEKGRGTALGKSEGVKEWREGHDKVVEMRRASGDEPNVQVVKNAYPPSTEVGPSTIPEEKAVSEGPSQEPLSQGTGDSKVEVVVDEAVVDEDEEDDEDEAESSELDEPPKDGPPTATSALTDRKKRLRSQKPKHPVAFKPVPAARRRRRHSFRRGLLRHAHRVGAEGSSSTPAAAPIEDEEEPPRVGSSRDSSPVRTVHFATDGGERPQRESGGSTPPRGQGERLCNKEGSGGSTSGQSRPGSGSGSGQNTPRRSGSRDSSGTSTPRDGPSSASLAWLSGMLNLEERPLDVTRRVGRGQSAGNA